MNQPKGIVIKHTADKMKAFVALPRSALQVTSNMLLTELLHKGIVHGLNTKVINALAARPMFDKFIEVAQGTPARPGNDGRIEVLLPGFEGQRGDAAAANLKQLCDFTVVKAGTPIARRIPPVAGADGTDVFGAPIVVAAPKDIELRAGTGVMNLSDDPNYLLAEQNGIFKQTADGVFEVRPFLEIKGDVDEVSGDVIFDGYVRIIGAVRPGLTVDASDSIFVGGIVDGASIRCGGDLMLYSGVRGGGKSVIECGGSIEANGDFESAALSAGGDVTVAKRILHSHVSAEGVVKAACILGGNVSAAGGIRVLQAGGKCRTQTVLDVGAAYGYSRDIEALKNIIDTQNQVLEGHSSQLYTCVREYMDEEGVIPEARMRLYEQCIDNLTASISVSRNYSEDMARLDGLLKSTKECMIEAGEIYPNVLLKLGLTEQNVKDVLKNVYLKPTVPVVGTGK